jgi:hypothetical protein
LESGELPLNLCRLQLSLRYWVRISINTENTATNYYNYFTDTHTLAPKQTDCGEREGKMVHLATKNTYGLPQPPAKCLLPMAPWILPSPAVCTNIGSAIKKKAMPILYTSNQLHCNM